MHKQTSKKKVKMPGNSSASNPFRIEWPRNGGNKLIGAYIPRQDADYLNLLAMYEGTTASKLIRDAIEKAINKGVSEHIIIDSLVDMAIKEWESRCIENQEEPGWSGIVDLRARWREYQQEMRLLLIKRSIADTLIVRIIRKLEIAQGNF